MEGPIVGKQQARVRPYIVVGKAYVGLMAGPFITNYHYQVGTYYGYNFIITV